MAGHSKWSNIRHRKAGQDARRVKAFTKIVRELTVAARDGGGSVDDNPYLRMIVDKAKAAQMPKDTMERAIARGAGGQEGVELLRLTYEGYGPGGVAILIETMTDNRNRTVASLRHAFTRSGGNLGADGSVAYLFERKGQLFFEGANEDRLMEAALEAGAEDVVVDGEGNLEVVTAPEDYLQVKDELLTQDLVPKNAALAMIPANTVDVDAETAEKVIQLLDMLEDLDDVTEVHTNVNFLQEWQDSAS